MKIDVAIHSSDSNPLYLDFWESVSRAWKTKIGIEPVLIYIDHDYDTKIISEQYGKVIRIKPLGDIPLYVQCQTVRYWYATQLKDKVGIISDIDMYPLSKWYFKTQLLHLTNDKYVHLNPCMDTYGQIPACYHVAQGNTYANVLGNYSFDEYMNKAIDFSKSNDTSYADFKYWFVDERYSTALINNYSDKSIFEFIKRDGGQNGHRIDRPNWKYDKKLVTDDYYYDSHSIRPFTNNATELNALVDLMLDATHLDGYSTHIPVLEATIEYAKPKTIVEFGPGNYSTALFADTANNLMTVEMQSDGWYDCIANRYNNRSNVNVIKSLSPLDFVYLTYPDKIDLVFVDGHGDSRPAVINFFADRANTIITHDTEEPGYKWHLVKLPDSYKSYVCKKYNVYTTIYTKDKKLIEYIISKGL